MSGQSGRYYSNSAITLVALLLMTSLSPMAFADDDSEEQNHPIVGTWVILILQLMANNICSRPPQSRYIRPQGSLSRSGGLRDILI